MVEVDGREKVVDTYYYGKTTKKPKPPLVYWGKYVAHDNNRDGMGQYLKLTQNITAGVLERTLVTAPTNAPLCLFANLTTVRPRALSTAKP